MYLLVVKAIYYPGLGSFYSFYFEFFEKSFNAGSFQIRNINCIVTTDRT